MPGAPRIRRDLLLVLLALDTGLRVGEIASMRKANLDGCYITVDGKVGHRAVVASPEICDALERIGDETHFWLGQRGPLTTFGVKQAYRSLFDRSGISAGKEKNGGHCLRHTFAVNWLRAGGGLVHLQQMLGHSDLKSTMLYCFLAMADVQDAHLLHSPARRLGYVEMLVNQPTLPELRDPVNRGARQATLDKYPRIRQLVRQGTSHREIRRRVSVGEPTIQAALAGSAA